MNLTDLCLEMFMTLTTHSSSRHFSGALQTSVSLEIAVDSSLIKQRVREYYSFWPGKQAIRLYQTWQAISD